MTTPSELTGAFDDAVIGLGGDPYDALHAIINDILDSVKLACREYDENEREPGSNTTIEHVYQTVEDYVANNYGDS